MPTWTPDPRSGFSKDDAGIISITLTTLVAGPAENGGEEPYATLDTLLPASLPYGLPEQLGTRKGTKRDDGDWDLSVTFAGTAEGENENTFKNDIENAVVELDFSSAEDPIETHPSFLLPNGLAAKYKAQFEEGQFKGWPRKITNAGKSVDNPIYGQTSWYNPGAILRVTIPSKTFDLDWLKNDGKIDDPKLPARYRDLLQLPDGKSWLKRSVKFSEKGNVVQIVIEWIAGNWNPDIYKPR